jgi:hypothetical protein
MSTSGDAQDPPPASGPAPWIDVEVQGRVEWRDGDVVVSVPAKSGTTWMMNIVHQLRSGGDPNFQDVYVEIPWLELVERPGQLPEERLARWRSMPITQRRGFKTHSAPPTLPYVEPGSGNPDVKYIVVLRNPEEAIVSLKPFIEQHTQAFFDLWQVPRHALARPSFAAFYDEIVEAHGFADMLFGFLGAWWPLRHASNVRFVHFADLKRDHEGSIRALAEFLGFAPTAAQWPTILECCSFAWMKRHEQKFEAAHVLEIPILERGAMVRKGAIGAAHEDGMNEGIAARLRARGEAIIADPRTLAWFYEGGPLPAA